MAESVEKMGNKVPGERKYSKAQIKAIFGDDIPTITTDERRNDDHERKINDEWIKCNKPPHHG